MRSDDPASIPIPITRPSLNERSALAAPGWAMLPLVAIGVAGGIGLISRGVVERGPTAGRDGALIGVGVTLVLLGIGLARGLVPVTPGEAVVVQLVGGYAGTLRRPGLSWVHPGARRTRISTRMRSHETGLLKVNDAAGSPIEIAAAITWRVDDTARALFSVDDHAAFLSLQAQAAVRQVASGYPYDSRGDAPSLRASGPDAHDDLVAELRSRVRPAGLRVDDARFTRLAYAPEIAQAMLRVQQADAVVAARHRIVEGAVGMVELAMDRLAADSVVELDEERKATMIGNLLVVLCGDRDAQPVVNTGSLY